MTVLSPAQAYIGALMWLPADRALQAHDLLCADDLASGQLAYIHDLVGELARAGVAPHPTAVLAAAIDGGRVSGATSIKSLTLLLIDLHDHRATVPSNVRFYACAALADAVRRRTADMAARLAQIAEYADLDELARVHQSETEAITALRRRHTALTRPLAGVGAARVPA